MSQNVTQPLAVDKNGQAIQNSSPEVLAQQRYSFENGVASSVVTLSDNTTMLEVAAIGQPAVLRWVASTDTQGSVISAAGTANFDVIIQPNEVRKIPIPIEKIGVSSIVGLGVQAGLYRRVAWKTTGIGSILAAEY